MFLVPVQKWILGIRDDGQTRFSHKSSAFDTFTTVMDNTTAD